MACRLCLSVVPDACSGMFQSSLCSSSVMSSMNLSVSRLFSESSIAEMFGVLVISVLVVLNNGDCSEWHCVRHDFLNVCPSEHKRLVPQELVRHDIAVCLSFLSRIEIV